MKERAFQEQEQQQPRVGVSGTPVGLVESRVQMGAFAHRGGRVWWSPVVLPAGGLNSGWPCGPEQGNCRPGWASLTAACQGLLQASVACGLASVSLAPCKDQASPGSSPSTSSSPPPCHPSLSSFPHSGRLPLPYGRPCGPGPFTEPWLASGSGPSCERRGHRGDMGEFPGGGRVWPPPGTPPCTPWRAPSSTHDPPTPPRMSSVNLGGESGLSVA